jgi:hypothetical protein
MSIDSLIALTQARIAELDQLRSHCVNSFDATTSRIEAQKQLELARIDFETASTKESCMSAILERAQQALSLAPVTGSNFNAAMADASKLLPASEVSRFVDLPADQTELIPVERVIQLGFPMEDLPALGEAGPKEMLAE